MKEKNLKLNIGENHVSSDFELTLCLDSNQDYSHQLKLTSSAGHECQDAGYRVTTSAVSVTVTSKELQQLSEFFTRAWLELKDSKANAS